MTTDNFYFYLQNRLLQTSQTGGQWYSDTSPFGIPWLSIQSGLLQRPLAAPKDKTGQAVHAINQSIFNMMSTNEYKGSMAQGFNAILTVESTLFQSLKIRVFLRPLFTLFSPT
jgi:hypothetical protein